VFFTMSYFVPNILEKNVFKGSLETKISRAELVGQFRGKMRNLAFLLRIYQIYQFTETVTTKLE
jgi:hypothetical protein